MSLMGSFAVVAVDLELFLETWMIKANARSLQHWLTLPRDASVMWR